MKLKFILSAMALFVGNYAFSQNLENHVPKDATIVIHVDGKNLLDKLSLDDLSKMPVMQELAKEMSRRNTTDLREIGIDWSSGMYFFVHYNDTSTFYSMLLDVNDKEKFKSSFYNGYDDLFIDGDLMRIKGYGELIEWNDDYALFIGGDEKRINDYYYYDDYENKVEYDASLWGELQLSEKERTNYYYEEYPVEETVEYEAVEEIEYAIDEEEVESPDVPNDQVNEVVEETEEVSPTEAVRIEADDEREEYELPAEEEMEYQPNIRKIDHAILMEAQRLRSLKMNDCIVSDLKIMSNIKDDSDASMILDGSQLGGLLKNLGGGGYGMQGMMMNGLNSTMWADNTIMANLFFKKNEMLMSSELEYSDEMAKSYKRIYDAEINKDFFDYIPSKNPVGYYSAALNTQAFLEELPKTMESQFKNIPGVENDLSVILDLYSVILDEEAIAEVIPGDLLFVVSAIRPIEVEYSTYDYDENFERTEKKMTKEEKIPEFLLMVSTENSELANKLLELTTMSDEFVKSASGYYELKANEYDPMQLFMLERDGIMFLCNSREQLNYIQAGGGKVKLNKAHVSDIKSTSSAMFIDGERILKDIQTSYLGQREAKQLQFAADNVKQMRSKQLKMKGNTTIIETSITIPKGYDNSFSYLFELIDSMYRIDKGMN